LSREVIESNPYFTIILVAVQGMYKGEARVEAMRTIKEALALTWGRYHHNLD
jgi:hypothetical protein